ncbi:hypothetical protein BH160DRAFT_2885 [Burkholderia sp. H160]|nr:hypothetical protein BH160DRAFT_2885 [Burkholderia sp. H160]
MAFDKMKDSQLCEYDRSMRNSKSAVDRKAHTIMARTDLSVCRMSNNIDQLSARLRRLEDLDAIRQLFVDYGFHLDRGDFSSYAALFAEEGELLLGPMGRARGPRAIQQLMESRLGGTSGLSYHLIANPVITLGTQDYHDQATSIVTWAVIVRNPQDAPSLTMLGHHRDVLIRQARNWKFLRREGHIDLPSHLPKASSRT